MLDDNIFPLPTLPNLGVDPSQIPANIDAKEIAREWFSSFQEHILSADIDKLLGLFIAKHAYWRDILSLTWTIRTFCGNDKIKTFLQDRLEGAALKNFSLTLEEYTQLSQPAPDLLWIQFFFKFDIGNYGNGLGSARLVPVLDDTQTVKWRAHLVLSTLENLKNFPEQTGPNRPQDGYGGNTNWERDRANETAFDEKDPVALVVGGAQCGLEVAARLKVLNISCLVVDKGERIGGNWINRYASLRLHDPVWYDHMPYLPFPENWPVYPSALKMANWLQYYAEVLELNVWVKSTVEKATRDPETGIWSVLVTTRRSDADGKQSETQRVFKVKHLIFATGLVPEIPSFPEFPGLANFKGEMVHAYSFKTAANYKGKKIVVIGAATAAHDISADCYQHGLDVTMYQRSSTYIMSAKNGFKVFLSGLFEEGGPPTEIADRINASFPNAMGIQMLRRKTQTIAELDKDLLDGLHARGFRTNSGYRDSGFFLLLCSKGGGYYHDVGSSKLIIDGKIKLKSNVPIQEFVEDGIKFEDGTHLPADVVICATGLGDTGAALKQIVGLEGLQTLKPIWDLDDEGELRGVFKETGVPNLWCIMGSLGLARYYSRHIALQIKAMEENLFGERYSA